MTWRPPSGRHGGSAGLTLRLSDEPDALLALERVGRDQPRAAAGGRRDLTRRFSSSERQREHTGDAANNAEARLRRRIQQRRHDAAGPVRRLLCRRLRRLSLDGEGGRRREQHQSKRQPQDLVHGVPPSRFIYRVATLAKKRGRRHAWLGEPYTRQGGPWASRYSTIQLSVSRSPNARRGLSECRTELIDDTGSSADGVLGMAVDPCRKSRYDPSARRAAAPPAALHPAGDL